MAKKEIHKRFNIQGMIGKPSTMEIGFIPLIVNITRDKRGCSLSIGCEKLDLQFTIPMEQVLECLEGNDER